MPDAEKIIAEALQTVSDTSRTASVVAAALREAGMLTETEWSRRRDHWWDTPGALALVIVIPGLAVFSGLYALLSFLVHGEWPSW